MSFFQTMILFFCATALLGAAFNRFGPKHLSFTNRLIYPVLAIAIFSLVCWTIVQMLFGLPKFDTVFPITATMLGILFAVGLKGAYITLKQRKSGR
jgi:hypothetical protein